MVCKFVVFFIFHFSLNIYFCCRLLVINVIRNGIGSGRVNGSNIRLKPPNADTQNQARGQAPVPQGRALVQNTLVSGYILRNLELPQFIAHSLDGSGNKENNYQCVKGVVDAKEHQADKHYKTVNH